jgi:acetyltransferase-like isoleucine patch superfamily enzyme
VVIPAVVIVGVASAKLARSSRPAALATFAGQTLVARAVATARLLGAPVWVAASDEVLADPACAGLPALPAADDGPGALLERARSRLPAGGIALAIDAACPLLSAGALERAALAARGGAVTAGAVAAVDLASGAAATPLVLDGDEGARVVDKASLVHLERAYYRRRAEALLEAGLLVRDPARLDVAGDLTFDDDVEIAPDVAIHGTVHLGPGVRVGPGCILRDATIGAGTEIRAYSMVEGARIGERCFVGPYARIRPDTVIGDASSIGNYVEIKTSNVGAGARINHLAFVGDAMLESHVTLGAGVITCNHDGQRHQRTVIGERAYVGSGTELIAPIEVGEGATIGSGSTITRDVPAGKLTVARARQVVVEGWTGPRSQRG